MADDKRIRVSADASPLQELRQSAQALWDDLTRMEGRFKGLADETVASIQKQIDLLKERNSLSREFYDQGATYQLPPTGGGLVDPNSGRSSGGLAPGQSTRNVDLSIAGRQLTVLERIYSQMIRIADSIEQGERNDANGILPSDGGGEGNAPVPPSNPTDRNRNREGGSGGFRIPTSAGALLGGGAVGMLVGFIGSLFGRQAQFNATQYGAENMFQRQNNIGNHWLLNMLTFGMSGAKAQEAEVGRLAASRNDSAINSYTQLHNLSYTGGLRSQIGGFFKENPFKTVVSNTPNVAYAGNEAAMAGEPLRRFFSKWRGGKTNEAYDPTGTVKHEDYVINSDNADEYHNWSSDVLGLNITDYLSKVSGLQRAGVKGRNTSIEDMNQLLMAGRIRGLSEESASSVLGTTRFGRGGLTGAGVVQAFDTNLQGIYQGRPDADQRIASTLDEYLRQFNRISESILEKAGSVNTAGVVRSMTSLQNATGMEGRQLERVQNSLMGVNISQDETTQALLLRTARQLNPNGHLSDLQAMIEKMPEDPKLQESFFNQIRNMTGGGEQMRQVMKSIFPDLHMSDIVDLDNGKIDLQTLFKKGRSKGNAYSEENAQSKVGGAESSTAATQNRQIIDGVVKVLSQSGTSIKEVLTTLDKPIPVSVIEDKGNVSPTVQAMNELTIKVSEFVSALGDPVANLKKALETANWTMISTNQ